MNLDYYLEALPEEFVKLSGLSTVQSNIRSYTKGKDIPVLDDIKICIIGVPEDRKAVNNRGCDQGPNYIRESLYKLHISWDNFKIADLGNIRNGETHKDTLIAVETVISYLLSNKIIPIIIGGSQEITLANYKAYINTGKIINILSVDSLFDLGTEKDDLNSKTYLSKIILHQPNCLFNYTNMGYQTYFIDQEEIRLMEKLFFDTYRLGEVRKQKRKFEPLIRSSDIISFDVSSIKISDAPGSGNAGPNGFDSVDACQIARYAGLSQRVTSFGVYETNPRFDVRNQTSMLVAQMIWCFLEGFSHRDKDNPAHNIEKFQKFYVKFTDDNEDFAEELLFYKNIYNGSWWMEIPLPSKNGNKKTEPYIVPCSEKDFDNAKNNIIPERWFQFYKKLL
ncbi:MAG: formimidoylglutamase [Hyphomicrobiales bacterium]